MSSHITVIDGDRVVMLSDGAKYDDSGVLRGIGRKVEPIGSLPAAIITRGRVGHGDKIKSTVVAMFAEAGSVDAGMAMVQSALSDLPIGQGTPVEMTLAIYSESRGPLVMVYDNHHAGWRESSIGFVCEQALEPAMHAKLVASPGIQSNGLRMMEYMRGLKASAPGQTRPEYFTGGQVDFTIIDHSGVRSETIHTWPDVIGQKIAPASAATSLGQAPLMNRQQRRAMGRQHRKVGVA